MQVELLPMFYSAAIDACQNVLSVDFDFLNSGVSVITDRRITDVDRRDIQTAIAQAGQTARPDVEHWPVQIRRVRDYAFTPHGRIEPHRLISSPRRGSIPVFDIPYAALMSMREGEQRLKVLAEGFDYIVTFAAGGTSSLIRWSMTHWDLLSPLHPTKAADVMDDFAKQYHLTTEPSCMFAAHQSCRRHFTVS